MFYQLEDFSQIWLHIKGGKAQNFWNPTIFWQHSRTYHLNLANSEYYFL
jgi:hypothetical protein